MNFFILSGFKLTSKYTGILTINVLIIKMETYDIINIDSVISIG